MNYTPKDLEGIIFKREILYGYNREQVNKLLIKICEDYDTLKKENEELQKNITIMDENVHHYKTIEESLQHTLILAQRTSDTIKNNAYEKANNIIKEAEVSAQKIINEANQKVANISMDYEATKKSVSVFKLKSNALLMSMMEILKDPFEEMSE
ncbi:MAG: DivIVA domain protein [Herbinix sp.]|jgi:cell division initiation protein|nr:DivIVA domain protein [Herbinix sp.]